MFDILLIEDFGPDAEYVKTILDDIPIINKLVWKQSKHEAIEYLEQEDHNFGLVLSDVITPDTEDYNKKLIDVCDEFKIPVVLLTGATDLKTKIEGYRLGAITIIEKPLVAHKLISVISALNTIGLKIVSLRDN